jgi:hypothetical protein
VIRPSNLHWKGILFIQTRDISNVLDFIFSDSLLYYYSSLGFFSLDWRRAIEDIAMISRVATFVESLPLPTVFDDNITVPFVSILLGIVFSPAFIS